MKNLFNSKAKLIGLIAAVLVLFALPPLYSSYWVTLLTQMLIFAILAMSLDILVGYSGLSSFGHAGFFGVAGTRLPSSPPGTRWGSSTASSAVYRYPF